MLVLPIKFVNHLDWYHFFGMPTKIWKSQNFTVQSFGKEWVSILLTPILAYFPTNVLMRWQLHLMHSFLINQFQIIIFLKMSIRFVIHLNRCVLCHFINKTRPLLAYFGVKKNIYHAGLMCRINFFLTNFGMITIQTHQFRYCP